MIRRWRAGLPQGRRLVVIVSLLLVLATLLLFSMPARSLECSAAGPTVVSHRACEAELGAPCAATAETLESQLVAGVRSFDVDLWWSADASEGFFIGHPPSLLKLWGLQGPLSAVPLAELRAKAGVRLFSLEQLLTLLARDDRYRSDFQARERRALHASVSFT